MEAGVEPRPTTAVTVRRAQILRLQPEGEKAACILKEGGRILVSNFLAAYIRPGDQVDFPLALDSTGAGAETYIRKGGLSARSRDLFQAPICYAAQPKPDNRDRLYVRAVNVWLLSRKRIHHAATRLTVIVQLRVHDRRI